MTKKKDRQPILPLSFKLALVDIKLEIRHVFSLYHAVADNAIQESTFLKYYRLHREHPNAVKDKRIKPEDSEAYFEARDLISHPICDGSNDYAKYVSALADLLKGVHGLRRFARPGSMLLEPFIDELLEEGKALVATLRLTDEKTTPS